MPPAPLARAGRARREGPGGKGQQGRPNPLPEGFIPGGTRGLAVLLVQLPKQRERFGVLPREAGIDQSCQELPGVVRSDQIQGGRQSLVLVPAVSRHDGFTQEAGGADRVSGRGKERETPR